MAALPIDSRLGQYFASGSISVLERVMEVCTQFEDAQRPPSDEAKLVEYCTLLGYILESLHSASDNHPGGKPNCHKFPAGCSSRQRCQQLS